MEVTQASRKKRRSFGWLIGIAVKSTKLFKAFKFLKVLITPLLMLLSILVYGWSLGFWFAAGFVILLFIHEMGHVIAMKIKGYQTKMPVFIPFLGAVIFAPKFNNREDEAYIGYGGPFLGGLAALALFGVWAILPQRSDLLITLSYVAVFLNLFNLVPIRPMDGGRITQVIGRWFMWIGAAALVVLTVVLKSPFMFLIGILALGDINISARRRFQWALGLGLAMIAMIALRISSQGLGADLLDIFLAEIFISIYYLSYKKKAKERAEGIKERGERIAAINEWRAALGKKALVDKVPEDEPVVTIEKPAPVGVRVKWLLLYLGLAALLIAGLAMQLPHLPAHLHK